MRLTAVYLSLLGLVLLFSEYGVQGQDDTTKEDDPLGTGVDEDRDVMDTCSGAAGPRPVDEVYSPGRTDKATVDDVNGGFCGVEINTPGIWWWVNGTGEVIRASTCHQNTNIKVKFSIFTGTCGNLRCVTGESRPDYECPILKRGEGNNEWGTIANAIDFATFEGQHYYILVQEESGTGTVWTSFRHPTLPQNDDCINAIGPVPRDMTPIPSSTVDGRVSVIPAGYCGGGEVPGLYPGSWFQLMGTGGAVTVMACGWYNLDGFYFSVYHGADCDSLECVDGSYEINVQDPEKCTFGTDPGERPVQRGLTKYTFNTRDRDRYYIYVHYARTAADKPTGDFLFFADDGAGGKAGSSGPHLIEFEESTLTLADESNGDSGKENKPSSANSLATLSASIVVFVTLCCIGV
mmetsp:Transcript_6081/g.9501  ORF Transcript_6081/g.9501 Transcript_6081/m.9501 type:complete len:406 (+) Transcript_6081:133-1350(+)